MAKNAYTGKNLDVKFIGTGGTITLTGNQTAFTHAETIDMVEQTAGADTAKTYVPTVKDSRQTFAALFQSGTNTGGTATINDTNIAVGMEGTLIWSPEGTATGKPKFTVPAIPTSISYDTPYADTVKISIDFQGNGAVVKASN